ncbi:MAG: histidinol-phosphatase HisJ family protein [Eubacteriales bacterium]|nr:histidinol-phosphatase HisJ family protein [Eubacteriales bacterium]
MPVLSDYHLHSHHSGDSEAPMEAQINAALAAGLTSLCFTEHYDRDFPYDKNPEIPSGDYGMFELDMERYHEELLSLRRKYDGRIRILFGIELGLQPQLNEDYHRFLADWPQLDFVIGSTHLAGETDPYYPRFFAGRSEEEAYREYFAGALSCVRACDCFDSYGHLDYVVRYGPTMDRNYTYEKYRDLIDPLLELLIARGKALELNTSPASKGCRDLNPCKEILKKYRSLGGEMVTVGSDAHTPDKIASSFDRAAQTLLDCGFSQYVTFEKRQPVFHRL